MADTVLGSRDVSGTEAIRLFTIGKSQNANVMCYDAILADASHFSATEPISAYWLMKADAGQREDMTWLEREHVYGFTSQLNASRTSVVLRIHALESRAIYVALAAGLPRAEAEVNGRIAILDGVFVKTSHGVFPGVDSVRLTGRDPASGVQAVEVVHP